jgi:Fic family protein
LTIPQAKSLLGVTHRAAALNVAKLVETGILHEVGDRSRNRLFLAMDVVRAVEGLPVIA